MSLSTKILVSLVIIALICVGGFVIYKENQTAQMLTDIQKSIVLQKQLLDGITRAQSQYASKDDLDEFAKQQNINLSVIQKDLDTLNAQIQSINGVTVISKGQVDTNVPSTTTTPAPNPPPVNPQNPDPYGYLKNVQHLQLNEKFIGTDNKTEMDIPFGDVSFSAWMDKPWSLNVPDRKYSITTVLGVDDNGKQTAYNKFSITSNNKTYDVQITDSKLLQQYPPSKFRFSPRLFLTAGGGVDVSEAPITGSANAGVALGLMSIGQFVNKPDISILQVGAAYQTETKRPAVVVNPINFNVSKLVPLGLVDNTYVGPSAQVDTKGNIVAGANISVGF